jgi:hypothetical protein
MYDPTVGRSIQRDDTFGTVLAPQSLNRFSYALNNPARLNDPSGLSTHDPDGTRCGNASFDPIG